MSDTQATISGHIFHHLSAEEFIAEVKERLLDTDVVIYPADKNIKSETGTCPHCGKPL